MDSQYQPSVQYDPQIASNQRWFDLHKLYTFLQRFQFRFYLQCPFSHQFKVPFLPPFLQGDHDSLVLAFSLLYILSLFCILGLHL